MKHLNNWLGTSKISLNAEKTKLVIFKSPKKALPDEIEIKFSGKRLNTIQLNKKSWYKD